MSGSQVKKETDSTDANLALAPPRTVTKAVSVPSKTPPGTSFKNAVTIEVGPSKQAFVIHKEFLCFYSDYFRGAFNGSFKEAVEGKLSLPNELVDVFDVFNTFVYTRQICPQGDGSTLTWNALCRV